MTVANLDLWQDFLNLSVMCNHDHTSDCSTEVSSVRLDPWRLVLAYPHLGSHDVSTRLWP